MKDERPAVVQGTWVGNDKAQGHSLTPELPNRFITPPPHSHQAGTGAEHMLITFAMTLSEEACESHRATLWS